MKQFFALALGVLCLSGCQGFKYHDPHKPHRSSKKGFQNNYLHEPQQSVLKWQWERLTTTAQPEPAFAPEVLATDLEALKKNREKRTFTWIGHSSALLQMEKLNVLIDPVFSQRASPFSFMGPRRLAPVPFAVEQLPEIDIVVISHNHYDHLDMETIKRLHKRSAYPTKYLVPLGLAELFKASGIMNVQEFDWWEEQTIGDLKFTFTPAQHWTRRKLNDTNKTLWGGWFITSQEYKFYYTGDTGYSADFKDIQQRLGDADFSMIPIGAYAPRWFMKSIHVNPEESVRIHKDLHSKLSVGVHWGTFRLTDEPMLAPIADLAAAIRANPLPPGSVFKVLKHGETIEL